MTKILSPGNEDSVPEKNDMSKDNFDKKVDSKEKIGQQIGSSRKAKEICGLVMKQRHEL